MPTLTTFVQALADALDDREPLTLSGGSTTTAVSASLINAVTGVTSGLHEGQWFYNLTKGTQSKVSLYVPGTGTLTVTPAVTANANADVGMLSSLFPVLHTVGAETDYRTIINRSLGRMGAIDEITQAISTGDEYSLTAYLWLDRPERLVSVREPSPVSGRIVTDSMWRGWELVPDPPTAKLRVQEPFTSTSGSPNIAIEAIRPQSTWIAVSSSWAESTVGLVNPTDEAQPSVEEWLPFGLAEALTVMIARSPGRPNAEWLLLLAQAQAAVKVSRYRDLTQEQPVAPAPEAKAA